MMKRPQTRPGRPLAGFANGDRSSTSAFNHGDKLHAIRWRAASIKVGLQLSRDRRGDLAAE
jgi:hypothetical protein